MKKQWKLFLVSVCTALLLCSCTLTARWVDRLGFDTYDYMSESVHTVHETDGEIAQKLADMISILTPALTEFDSMKEAIPAYRDQVLSYMLETEYARYSGNLTLIEKASKAYPEYQITQIIPAADFESVMYRYFGGSVKISHKDGSRFRYLRKVGAYISLSSITTNETAVDILSIEETEKTYRVLFTSASEEAVSSPYFLLIIKRTDGTLYFKQLVKQTLEN